MRKRSNEQTKLCYANLILSAYFVSSGCQNVTLSDLLDTVAIRNWTCDMRTSAARTSSAPCSPSSRRLEAMAGAARLVADAGRMRRRQFPCLRRNTSARDSVRVWGQRQHSGVRESGIPDGFAGLKNTRTRNPGHRRAIPGRADGEGI